MQIAIIQGHPDPDGKHFGHALASAYAEGAESCGHSVEFLDIARLQFPLLHSQEDFEKGTPPANVRDAQDVIRWADHLAIFYPLWLGTMPAILKAFFEQVLRPGFAFEYTEDKRLPTKLLHGKTAHIVVTMGMPAFFYRWYYRAHGTKNLKRNILRFCGISPVRVTTIGAIESIDHARRKKWLKKLRHDGRLCGRRALHS